MSKYKEKNFYQANKIIDDPRFDGLPYQSIYIYTIMQELEHKYTSDKTGYFFRSDEDFARDCRMPLSTFKRYKSILIKRNNERTKENEAFFRTWLSPFYNPKTGKRSILHTTHYELLD